MNHSIKQILRNNCLTIRNSLSLGEQQKASTEICKLITQLKEYRHSKRIALYQAMRREVDLTRIWDNAPLQGKYCYFPVTCDDKSLIFLPATPKTPFKNNKYGILEPQVDHKEKINPETINIIFIPLVAFDLFGTRLGMGKGYYDRSIPNTENCLKIGIAYEFQKLHYIPVDPWDIPLDKVITEKAVYDFR